MGAPSKRFRGRVVAMVTALGLGLVALPARGVGQEADAPRQVAAATVLKSDFTGDGKADVLATEVHLPGTGGTLWLYPGSGAGGFLPREFVGNGWHVMTALIPSGDWNGDGTADLLARDSGGTLWLYPGRGSGDFGTRAVIGVGWNGMTSILGPGDFNGDARPDVIARDTGGRLWLYPGNGTGGWLPRLLIGIGWAGMTAMVAPGDFSGDGNADLITRESGRLWLFRGNGAAGFVLPRVQIGSGWDGMTAITGPGDFSGDGHADLLARTSTAWVGGSSGDLVMYRGNGAGGWIRPPLLVGIYWNGMRLIVS